MGLKFNRRIKLGKHTHINLSKSGVSFSKNFGRLTLNSKGGGSFKLGKGFSYTFGKKKR